jgi:hypothetical protein
LTITEQLAFVLVAVWITLVSISLIAMLVLAFGAGARRVQVRKAGAGLQ